MPKDRATTPDLVRVCRRYYTRPEAEVAAEVLYWSQFAKHKLRGADRIGFFKEDAELAETIAKDRSSIRRALASICAKPGEERPETLFIREHGPRPWERSGRVRWLFRTPRGHELISEALLLSASREGKRQKASTGRSDKTRPMSADCTERSAQNEPTLIKQNHYSESQPESLSSPRNEREKSEPELQDKNQEVEKVATIWNEACHASGETSLVWLPTEVKRFSAGLAEIIDVMRLDELSNEELLKRFRLLCRKDSADHFGPSLPFKEYNRHGITIQSFARYGRELMRAVDAELAERATPRRSLKDLPLPLPSQQKKELTSEEPEARVELLARLWTTACIECDRPGFVWNHNVLEERRDELIRFIQRTRLHQMPDHEVLVHLRYIARTLMGNHVNDDRAFQVFLSHGSVVLGWSVASAREHPKAEVSQ